MHHARLARALPLAGLLAALLAQEARALVNQIDGTVVPIQNATNCAAGNANSCVQVALNLGEGFPAASTMNPLNAVVDAAVAPEVFAIPQTGGVYGSITVRDQVEGAGFENTFGWYNVNDPANLYIIHPCSDEPGATRTVNFQTEFTAGRYLGGFVGFFLVTPEGSAARIANGDNCGNPANSNQIGRIYYTETARNGDGNYVHYLVYRSKVDTKRFYFGFEDLFRGGDNDFEDMFVQVDGLVVPCTPSAEVCDGKDNNCDGLVDNAPVDAGGDCGATDVGECRFGTVQCLLGQLVCLGAVGPSSELCNGLDDDCDGAVDDTTVGEGDPCGIDTGLCEFGAKVCVGGVFVCTGGTGPSLEKCNLEDDDCDGFVDDFPIEAGGACGSNVGTCTAGTNQCVDGMIVCDGGTGPTPELCNGLDDDCNGAADDGNPGGGAVCGTDVGTCQTGTEFCVGGSIQCVGAIGPVPEVCDGLDNDCDGTFDVLAECPDGSQCIAGSCAAPCEGGEFPCPGGQTCVEGFCLDDPCDAITCPEGERCEAGACVPDGGGGGGGAGGAGGSAGGEPQGGGGASGTTASTTSAASGGAGDPSGGGGAGASDAWGLPTGGGGLRCTTSGPPTDEPPRGALPLALLGLAFAVRSSRRSRGGAR
jgi:Notch-like protein